jgi:hypothetical protein
MPLDFECICRLDAGWQYGSWTLQGGTIVQRARSLDPLLVAAGDICHLIVEQPTFFNSEAGRIAAREGTVFKLSIVVGYLLGRLRLNSEDITLYTPSQWKGMVTKDITRKKFYRVFKDAAARDAWGDTTRYDHDTVDAVMMLHYWLTQRSKQSDHLTRVKIG